MTDKQIVVDGVDVSECAHVYARTSLFKEKTLVQCYAFFLENEDSCCDCSDNPNCYYKQLKAKEQECEELKSVRDSWISKCEQETKIRELYQDRLDQLKAELEQEKALKETYFACYKAKHEDIEGALFKLRQTLAEIKEISREEIKNVSEEFIRRTPMFGVHKQILQKISEVLEND